MVVITNGTCGDPEVVVSNETWTTANAFSFGNDSLTANYTFGTPKVGVAGAFYRLCWGHEPLSIEGYNVEVDPGAELAGPYVRDLECTLGVECAVTLEGYRFSAGNRIVLVNGTCGDPQAVVANETWTTANATSLAGDALGANYTFGTPTVGLVGSFYRLCWGHEPVSVEDYNVEVDSDAELAGPYVRDLQCTFGLECLVILEGYRLNSGNQMVVVNGSCGDPQAVVANETWTTANATSLANDTLSANYSFGTPTVGLAGSFYRLCWGNSPVILSDYNIEVDASAQLSGPFVSELSCTLGVGCRLELTGYGLALSNSLVVVNGSCEDRNSVVHSSFGSVTASAVGNGSVASFDFGTPVAGVPGGFYQLCWSHDLALGPQTFQVDGDFGFVGPFVEDYECVIASQDSCKARVNGFGLQAFNKIVMGWGAGTCDSGSLIPVSLFFNPVSVPANGTLAQYDMGVVLFGIPSDQYKLCWSWNASSPDLMADYTVTVDGTFTLTYVPMRRLAQFGLRGVVSGTRPIVWQER
jgi:hypothetical protein